MDLEYQELHDLVTAVNLAQELEGKVAEDLKTIRETIRELVETDIPLQLQQMGLKKATLEDGTEIKLSSMYFASVKEINKARAYKWLRDNDFGDLIKRKLSVDFGKGDDSVASTTKKTLEKLGLLVSDKEAVNPQTLNGFVREQIREGNNIPREILGVYQKNEAKIKRNDS